jgi:hypothetical protein
MLCQLDYALLAHVRSKVGETKLKNISEETTPNNGGEEKKKGKKSGLSVRATAACRRS